MRFSCRFRTSQKDKQCMHAVVILLEMTWVNPFTTQYYVISISTASAVTPDVEHDLINARETGGKASDELKKTPLEENAYKDFYGKQPKLQLKTFSNLRNSNNTKVSGKRCHSKSKKKGNDQESIQSSITSDPRYQWESNNFKIRHLKADMRLLNMVASSRNLDMREVLKHPLGRLPWA